MTLLGDIDPRFLDLPPEVLQTSMRTNQKFFSLKDASGRITAYALVANRDTADDGATIRAGNARVLAARLADAEFFWQNDLRTPLDDDGGEARHRHLPQQARHPGRPHRPHRRPRPRARPRRRRRPRPRRARGAASPRPTSPARWSTSSPSSRAPWAAPTPSRAGEDPAVAAAAEEHYAPLGPSDAVPTAPVSVAVALADKLDTLAGFWAIDEKPTGSKDPFALRRAALGVIRQSCSRTEFALRLAELTLLRPFVDRAWPELRPIRRSELEADDTQVGHRYSVDICSEVQEDACRAPQSQRCEGICRAVDSEAQLEPNGYGELRIDLLAFLADRLKVHLRGEGIRHDVIDACFQLGGQDDLVLLVARVRALQDFLATDDGANLLAGYKRATNILTQEEKKDGVEYSLDPDPRFAETPEERALFAALDAAEAALGPALAAEDFAAAMTALARLRAPIDAFFDTTTVNADSPVLRRNRLCLLHRIRTVMNRVAVFSAIEG